MGQSDKINYPFDDMTSTAQSLQNFLEGQWSQHTALFMDNHDSYHALLHGIATQQPDSGSFATNLSQALHDYHQQFKTCYDSLQGLATQIDQASKTMAQTDQDISKGFNGFQND
jgi:uncharacterized protein YukE